MGWSSASSQGVAIHCPLLCMPRIRKERRSQNSAEALHGPLLSAREVEALSLTAEPVHGDRRTRANSAVLGETQDRLKIEHDDQHAAHDSRFVVEVVEPRCRVCCAPVIRARVNHPLRWRNGPLCHRASPTKRRPSGFSMRCSAGTAFPSWASVSRSTAKYRGKATRHLP